MQTTDRKSLLSRMLAALAACRRAVTFDRFMRLAWLAVAVFGVSWAAQVLYQLQRFNTMLQWHFIRTGG